MIDNQKKEYRQERFQFVLSVNDNIICQRYFKINGFNEESLNSIELKNVIDEITIGDSNNGMITSDLVSKSRVYTWYNYDNSPMKLNGFINSSDNEYIELDTIEESENEQFLKPWEVTFKFSFLVDEKEVCSRIWDGSIYPRFVRDSVDITNKKTSYENEDQSKLPFQLYLIKHMTIDKPDLVYKIIEKLCEVLSNTYSNEYEYTKTLSYGKKKYSLNRYLQNKKTMRQIDEQYKNKNKNYLYSLYPSKKECEFYDKNL